MSETANNLMKKGSDRLENVPGGGQVKPYVLMSLAATVTPGSFGLDEAELHDRAIVDIASIVRDYAKLFDDVHIVSSLVKDHARISGNSWIEDSVIGGTVSVVGDTIISNSIVSGNAIISGKATVNASTILGNTRIGGNARIHNLDLSGFAPSDFAIIAGDAELDFPVPLPIATGTRITEGVWTRPPLVIPTPYFYTVESVGDRVLVGCTSHSTHFWLKHGREVFLELGYPAEEFHKMYEAMLYMKAFKESNKSPAKSRKKYKATKCVI